MGKKNEIKYIQTESAAYTSDYEWAVMTPSERGNYHSIIVFLGCSNGKLTNDKKELQSLCNESEENFDKFWEKYKHKFQCKNGKIKHKRVSREIRKARKSRRQKSLAGVASGVARRNARSTAVQTTVPSAVELIKSKANLNNSVIINKTKVASALDLEKQMEACDLIEKIERAFKPLNNREQTTMLRVVQHIRETCPDKIYSAIEWLTDALEWKSNNRKTRIDAIRVFVSKVKKETGFKAKGKIL